MNLEEIAKQLVASGKGILAADESSGTADKRFDAVGVEKTEENRRQYRQLLFTAEGVKNYLSGVILYDETIRQQSDSGQSFTEVLQAKGIIAGIKVDKGLIDLPGFPGEKVSQGLDGLSERLAEYSKVGAKFTKWRSVIAIGEGIPTQRCIDVNAEVLALYAGLVQEAGMVPIVEPEVLLDGSHTLEESKEVLTSTLQTLFTKLKEQRVNLAGLILKTSMALPGKDSGQTVTAEEVAEATAEALRTNVPEDVGGVVFLSGGQSSKQATANLNAIAKLGPFPWGVTFSFSRAIQDPVLTHWAGKAENAARAQKLYVQRLEMNSLATQGKYEAGADVEDAAASVSQDL